LFTELDAQPLQKLFAQPGLVDFLAEQELGISMGLRDFSAERAEVVRRLNERGIPVHAWLLLPQEQGYWFNVTNHPWARESYHAFREWARQGKLEFARVGLDIEPPLNDLRALGNASGRERLCYFWKRWHARDEVLQARAAYRALTEEIRADGYKVDAYHLFIIADERLAGSTVLARLLGLINVPVDREVLMLYSSYVQPVAGPKGGPALILAYSAETEGIAIGSTGGGIGAGLGSKLSWAQLKQDLLIAGQLGDPVFIFSLEGCVQQGYLEELATVDWSAVPSIDHRVLNRVRLFRRVLQGALYGLEHIRWVIAGKLVLLAAVAALRWRSRSRRT
jgi:hypothetical protein